MLKKRHKTIICRDLECNEEIEVEKEKFKSKENFERSCYHEAGHFVCAEYHNIGIEEVQISLTNSFVALDVCEKDSEDDLHKLISVMYAGLLSEKIIFGTASSGFMGAEDSDMGSANEMLHDLVILSDDELSLTGLEEELIKEKMIELSKKIASETKEILLKNKDRLIEKANEFMESNKDLLEENTEA